jgi:hypothetical protein
LQIEAVRRNLSDGWEVKLETSAHKPRSKLPASTSEREEVYSAQVVCDACGSANHIAEEMA